MKCPYLALMFLSFALTYPLFLADWHLRRIIPDFRVILRETIELW